mmetsp:Transcript_29987/g.71386  ORF Transcript_29987/g.71386 Transcript_29987/m.71386 type:complete len:238 (-) Transcript_29987:39-752(-)
MKMHRVVVVLAGMFAAADAFSLAPSLHVSLSGGGRTRLRASAASLTCMEAGPSPRLSRRGLMVLLPVPLLLTVPGIVGAAEKTATFKATSPGVALDAIIVMKVVRELRESGKKIENGDFKSVQGFLTSPWSSNTAKFLRKNKVLESLAKSLLGAAGWGDLDSDPAFANEASPDSLQLEAKAAAFFVQLDALEAACNAQAAQDAMTAYQGSVVAMDAYLAAAGLPSVADADPKLIKIP